MALAYFTICQREFMLNEDIYILILILEFSI
jgi:hypothetical protein